MNNLKKWHDSRLGLIIFTLAELGLAYTFASLAIDQGNLLWYLLTLIFLVGGIRNFFKLIGILIHGKHTAS
jgi:hypothetical protein